MLTNEQRLKIILTNLENYRWNLRHVDDGNGCSQPVKGLTIDDRVDSAAEMIMAVDSAEVSVAFECVSGIALKSFVVLILSNEEDMLSDCGSLINDLDLNPTEEQELADFVGRYHATSGDYRETDRCRLDL